MIPHSVMPSIADIPLNPNFRDGISESLFDITPRIERQTIAAIQVVINGSCWVYYIVIIGSSFPCIVSPVFEIVAEYNRHQLPFM